MIDEQKPFKISPHLTCPSCKVKGQVESREIFEDEDDAWFVAEFHCLNCDYHKSAVVR